MTAAALGSTGSTGSTVSPRGGARGTTATAATGAARRTLRRPCRHDACAARPGSAGGRAWPCAARRRRQRRRLRARRLRPRHSPWPRDPVAAEARRAPRAWHRRCAGRVGRRPDPGRRSARLRAAASAAAPSASSPPHRRLRLRVGRRPDPGRRSARPRRPPPPAPPAFVPAASSPAPGASVAAPTPPPRPWPPARTPLRCRPPLLPGLSRSARAPPRRPRRSASRIPAAPPAPCVAGAARDAARARHRWSPHRLCGSSHRHRVVRRTLVVRRPVRPAPSALERTATTAATGTSKSEDPSSRRAVSSRIAVCSAPIIECDRASLTVGPVAQTAPRGPAPPEGAGAARLRPPRAGCCACCPCSPWAARAGSAPERRGRRPPPRASPAIRNGVRRRRIGRGLELDGGRVPVEERARPGRRAPRWCSLPAEGRVRTDSAAAARARGSSCNPSSRGDGRSSRQTSGDASVRLPPLERCAPTRCSALRFGDGRASSLETEAGASPARTTSPPRPPRAGRPHRPPSRRPPRAPRGAGEPRPRGRRGGRPAEPSKLALCDAARSRGDGRSPPPGPRIAPAAAASCPPAPRASAADARAPARPRPAREASAPPP